MKSSRTVLVYTHPGCPGGDRAIRFFQDQDMPIYIRDIAQNMDAWVEFQALGCIGTPVIVIDGQRLMGFDEERVSIMLGSDFDGPDGRWSHE